MPDVRLSSRSLTPVLCAVGLACALQGEVQAADGGPRDVATAPRVFDIAPGELAEVLLNIVRQGHVPIAFDQPIDVVSATQLRSSGAVDLRDALVKLLPSLTRQAQPFNASALTHTQSLRGLSPNHVLVLVN
ncbi:hypothetical protein B5L72_32205, partial [Pseudomonas aeruginosa]|uniref:TonB-dependent receptor plug domain-containing protein n=1 Tax=Pseudomonas aeruginosa TaxID=287 RepID=UPI0009CB5D74